MQLKLNGKPLELRPTPPSVLKAIKALDKHPADDLVSTSDMRTRYGIPYASLKPHIQLLADYTHRVGPVRYFGNPRAIAELRKQVGQ